VSRPREIDDEGTLIRFTGVLREDHRFIHVPAWETARVFERPESGDGAYAVDLVDGEAKVVSRVSPRIEFRPPEDPEGGGLYLADVLAYVPVHPSARLLVFRRLEPDELEIYRAELAPRPPSIEKLHVEGDPSGDFRLEWSSEHDRPVTFNVFYWPDGGPALLLASGLRENAFEIAGSRLPGPAGRFAVSASDGFRSSAAVSRPVEGLSTAIRIRITSPVEGSVLPPDQPVDLIARAEDVAGVKTTVDELVWVVDGQVAGHGEVAATPALGPGDHEIEATGLRDSEPVGRDVVRLTVADRNEDQADFAKRVADLPPLADRRRETDS
jgi:hypothetical protein